MFRLGHGDSATACCICIEVSASRAEDKVSLGVRLPCAHQDEICGEGLLQHVAFGLAVAGELVDLYWFGALDHLAVFVVKLGETTVRASGVYSRCGEKGRDARATGAHFLGEGALGDQVDLDFSREHFGLQDLVVADVGAAEFA